MSGPRAKCWCICLLWWHDDRKEPKGALQPSQCLSQSPAQETAKLKFYAPQDLAVMCGTVFIVICAYHVTLTTSVN